MHIDSLVFAVTLDLSASATLVASFRTCLRRWQQLALACPERSSLSEVAALAAKLTMSWLFGKKKTPQGGLLLFDKPMCLHTVPMYFREAERAVCRTATGEQAYAGQGHKRA